MLGGTARQLHAFERSRSTRWEGDLDRVSRTYDATGYYDTHHSNLTDYGAIRALVHHQAKKARLELVDLLAWVSKSREGDERVGAESKHRARWQAEQLQTARGDVLAEGAWGNDVTFGTELVVELGVDQMHLPEIGLSRIGCDSRPVLHSGAEVGIAGYAQAGDERNLLGCRLAEPMCRTRMNGGYPG